MTDVDLSKFTDRDLINLEKKIDKEKELRKQRDDFVYECDIHGVFTSDNVCYIPSNKIGFFLFNKKLSEEEINSIFFGDDERESV